jgi:CheY-like chemotaxis protein/DnaJ-domain-containing protein 1
VPRDVLIVEDDRQLAATLVRAVEKMGYAARAVHDGSAALEAVGQARPDGIVLDLLLPRKDGRAVLEALQRTEATRAIPVIAMSGVFRGREQQQALVAAGARAFLEKPFPAAALQAALAQFVGAPKREEAAAAAPVSGTDLAQSCVADVIWSVLSERFDGALHFRHRQRHKVLLLREGRPILVRSNLAREALGRRLLASGRIDERTLGESLRRVKATGRKQGEVLIELGAITRSELEKQLAEQAAEKLLELFAWTAGEAWRQPGIAEIERASELAGWSPQRVMLEGCLRTDREILLRALGPYLNCIAERGGVELEADPAGARALLARLERPATVRDLADEFLPQLYALWRIGSIAIEGTPATISPPAVPARASRLAELRARLEETEGRDYFAILGVERSASPADVRRAFVENAKLCHPDKLGDADAELRELAGRLFARLSDANETLSDPKARKAYLDRLTSGAKRTADPAAVARIVSAEQLFQKAEAHARRKEWAAAIEALRQALQLDPEEGEFHALLGWCVFMADSKARAQAIESLRKSISLAPNSPSGYFYLGRLHRICEQLPEAERMFRRLLELRPQHAEAAQELRLIERRRNERSGRGLFGLGRKK